MQRPVRRKSSGNGWAMCAAGEGVEMATVMFDRPLDYPLQTPGAAIPLRPLVSVIMTVHNSAPWLEAAVISILQQQDWENLELVAVDDASTDGSVAMLERLAKLDRRVRPFRLHYNHGTYRAKNIGMSISRGALVTFMDSDDTSSPDRIARQAAFLLDDGLIATTCNYMRRTESGQVVPMGGLLERQALISLMFRRTVLADIGWFDCVRTSADDEFFERIRHVYGRNAHGNIPAALYHALHREQSLSTGAIAPMNLAAADDSGMLSGPRAAYVSAYREWYVQLAARGRRPYVPFNIVNPRPFPVPSELLVSEKS